MTRTDLQRLIRLPVCLLTVAVGLGVATITNAADDAAGGAASETSAPRALEEFSPSFLGVYRKVMEIEEEIVKYSEKYGVDVSLAKAVCMYESGGNPDLTSSAGAKGYFQVMPSTFRVLRVPTNIEAGIKYLGQLVKQLGREDHALAAYNGGPGRVARGRPMPVESLQYVLGVGNYRSVLKLYEGSVRAHAMRLSLEPVRAGDDWAKLAGRLQMPLVQLRLHNPFLASRTLKPGSLVAYPPEPRRDLFNGEGGETRYRTRLGDNYLKVAFALGVDLDLMRQANELWRLQALLPGTLLAIPQTAGAKFTTYRVGPRDDILQIGAQLKIDPWWIVLDNHLWEEQLSEGMLLRIRQIRSEPASGYSIHRVARGENLSSIARRYGTTVAAIRAANSLKGTLIKIGQRLRIPAT